ncbi:MAG: DUF1269 domain-containing protein [bacterium]|nr:DUF1269 domain-containing protein [bacterium]MCP4968599.1 DUF1269 domain-containing protein [bacterium]
MSQVVVSVVAGISAGSYLMDMYEVQLKYRKFYLEDIAMAYIKDGDVEIDQTRELTQAKGAKRGAGIGLVAGFVIGGPIGAAVVGGGIGALVGRKQDAGVSNELMESLQSRLTNGQALVFARAEGWNANLAADFARDHGGADQVYTATVSDETESDLIAAYNEANP